MEGDHTGLAGTEGFPGMRDFQFGTRCHALAQDDLVSLHQGTHAYGLASGCGEPCYCDHVGSDHLSAKEEGRMNRGERSRDDTLGL